MSLLTKIKVALAFLGVLALGVAVALIRKSGADAEKALQARRDAEAARIINDERVEWRGATDVALDKRIEKWTRK